MMGGGLGETARTAPHAAQYNGVTTTGARRVVVFQLLVFAIVGFGFHPACIVEKIPSGGRMGHRVVSKLCPLCHWLEDHEHMLQHCRFSAFIFDTVRKAFGVVQREGGAVEPSRLLLDEPALPLQSTQGLVLWAALKAQWALRREA